MAIPESTKRLVELPAVLVTTLLAIFGLFWVQRQDVVEQTRATQALVLSAGDIIANAQALLADVTNLREEAKAAADEAKKQAQAAKADATETTVMLTGVQDTLTVIPRLVEQTQSTNRTIEDLRSRVGILETALLQAGDIQGKQLMERVSACYDEFRETSGTSHRAHLARECIPLCERAWSYLFGVVGERLEGVPAKHSFRIAIAAEFVARTEKGEAQRLYLRLARAYADKALHASDFGSLSRRNKKAMKAIAGISV